VQLCSIVTPIAQDNLEDVIRALICAALVLTSVAAQTVHRSPETPKFMGREVILTEPKPDDDGFYPQGPVKICIEAPSEEQCYTAPKDFGRRPAVELVPLPNGASALFFSLAGGGFNGFPIHFALLRPGPGGDLEDLFPPELSVSNQNRHAFWTDPAISEVPIFITADFVSGRDESHYEPHRFIISAYVFAYSRMLERPRYDLEDRYMTVTKYDLDANADVRASERPETIARLKKVLPGIRERAQ